MQDRYYIASDPAPTTAQGVMAAMNTNNFPAVVEHKLSTPDDVDSRTGERRHLIDGYVLHADHVDTVRLAFMETFPVMVARMERTTSPESAAYWYDELWAIERACRALGIES